MPDIAIPIAFPDYLIAVETPKTSFKIPDLLPGINILPDKVEIPQTKNKVPELGHAGILFINGRTGTTKYYEYGRYSSDFGNVRKLSIRDVKIGNDGHPTKPSLTYTLSQISAKSGHGGRISAAYIEVPGKYQAMLDYCVKRAGSKATAYSIFSNSCNHFMQGTLIAAGVDVPGMVDPRPTSYIEEIRDDFRDLDYSHKTNTMTIENPPASLGSSFSNLISQPAAIE
jgi:hypothetical protein